ncbi:MAG TPA: hypothetical protein PKA58_11215, partial [Polyangium sp.]|nr:hypothetical protein [Polyangium sp.]
MPDARTETPRGAPHAFDAWAARPKAPEPDTKIHQVCRVVSRKCWERRVLLEAAFRRVTNLMRTLLPDTAQAA